MEKYNVRIHLHTFVDVEVEADNEQEALEEAENKEYDMNQLLDNLVPDDEPTIERIQPIIEQGMNKYLDCELYQVEIGDDGKKQIHIDGYCYDNGEWDTDKYLQLVQFTWCIISLDDMQNNDEAISEAIDGTKQYQYDMSEDEVEAYYNEDGVQELAMCDVTEDTPCGWYIDPTFKH